MIETVNELRIKMTEYHRVRRTLSFLWKCLGNLKSITGSAVGMDQLLVEIAVHLIAHRSHCPKHYTAETTYHRYTQIDANRPRKSYARPLTK